MLVGKGAQDFALAEGFSLEPATLSDDAEKAYKEWLKKSEYKPVINIENKKVNGPFSPNYFDDGTPNHDTMGILALDSAGKIAGGGLLPNQFELSDQLPFPVKMYWALVIVKLTGFPPRRYKALLPVVVFLFNSMILK